jgi:DNA-binding NarL/FixJ family response regulator
MDTTSLQGLTVRQREVLAFMAEGRSNSWIARKLSVTERAVVQHVSHIYDLMGLPVSNDDHRRVLAVVRYLTTKTAPSSIGTGRHPHKN